MKDVASAAKSAGLSYVTDQTPGFRRKRRGPGFIYLCEKTQRRITARKILDRIKALVIPPAWEEVWICRSPQGHLQATGLDKRRRKQYRYHPRWTEHRNLTKFTRLREFGDALPVLRRRVEADLALSGLPRDKVLAAMVKIMLMTNVRVGNTLYAEENDSYGLSTILNDHAVVSGTRVELSFRGKSGVEHDITISDRRLARIVARCQELPGEELFCYDNGNGEVIDVTSTHVNDYLRRVTGLEFSAKDLRTWSGTTTALKLLLELGPVEDLPATKLKRRHFGVVKTTAGYLRNTVSVCRKYYIHPLVFLADESGELHTTWARCRKAREIEREEVLLLQLLKRKKYEKLQG